MENATNEELRKKISELSNVIAEFMRNKATTQEDISVMVSVLGLFLNIQALMNVEVKLP